MTRTRNTPRIAAALAITLAATLLGACSKEPPAAAPAPGAEAPAPTRPATPGVCEVRYYVLDKSCPYCRDLKTLIEGASDAAPDAEPPLSKVYAGRVQFTFRPGFDEHNNPNPEMAPFGFGGSAHGFAGFTPDGKLGFTSPGHHQSRAELVEMIDKMLR